MKHWRQGTFGVVDLELWAKEPAATDAHFTPKNDLSSDERKVGADSFGETAICKPRQGAPGPG